MEASTPSVGKHKCSGDDDDELFRVRALARPGLAPASFALARGLCLVLTGASGSGKTLLLRALADLDPNDGIVTLGGTSRAAIAAPEWRRRVVYVGAEAGWWATCVGDHFIDRAAAVPLIVTLLLPEAALDWPVSRLSTGERQRLALARAIALAPEVLLLDEPTSGLDPEAVHAAEALLRRELARGVAIVMVSHDRAQAERLADGHLFIAHGVLAAAEGAAAEGAAADPAADRRT